MPSLESLFRPLDGAKARRDANVALRDGVHAFRLTVSEDGRGWSCCRTMCGKTYKHHDRDRNRRIDVEVTCFLCLAGD